MSGLFRSWTPSPKGKDPEIQRLEVQAQETRQKILELKEQGRLRRAHRLQSLDALETRRMTLLEILKRMDQELQAKKVDDYADVLAEVFGERKIYAHRAIGLEALLCQFMHQMLAKQHQLKIIKTSAKDLQKLLQAYKTQNRDEFHSFELLAVHLETMRLSLEAQYDDIFAAQHSLLARLHHVEAGGTMTNYKIVKPPATERQKQPTLVVSKKHMTPSPLSTSKSHDGGESDDDDALMQSILMGSASKDEDMQTVNIHDSSSNKPPTNPRKSASQKSARDRRREIEQQRLASGRGSSSNVLEDNDKDRAREKLRALEAQAQRSRSSSSHGDELQERRSSSRRSSNSKTKDSGHASATNQDSFSHGNKEEEEEARQRRRQERRESRAAARASTATATS